MSIDFTKLSAKGVYKSETIADGVSTEQTFLDDQQNIAVKRGIIVYCGSDKAGTLRVYLIDRDNNNWLIDSTSVTANVLAALDFDYHVPRYKVTFQRTDTSGANAIWVESFDYN